MDKLTLAEHLLTPITGNLRATEIVGDLLEANPSATAFWFSIIRIALAYTWRWLLAVPAAMVATLFASKPYMLVALKHPPNMEVSIWVDLVGMSFMTVAAIALARYGTRSGLARLSCMFAILFETTARFLGMPHALISVPVALLALVAPVVIALSYAPWRRLFLCMFAAGFSFFLGVMVLDAAIAAYRIHYHLISEGVFHASTAGFIACMIGEAFVLSRTTRWLHVA